VADGRTVRHLVLRIRARGHVHHGCVGRRRGLHVVVGLGQLYVLHRLLLLL
jgi:hypothetical protein